MKNPDIKKTSAADPVGQPFHFGLFPKAARSFLPAGSVTQHAFPIVSTHNAVWNYAEGGNGKHYAALCNEFSASASVILFEFDPVTRKFEQLFDGGKVTLCPERAIPPSKIHTSIHPINDGRLVMSTHTTSPAPSHKYWMFDSHYYDLWEGFPGSHVLIFDPKTRKVETLGCPVPRDSIYGMVYDPDRNAVFFNTFLRGHLYRLDLDSRKLTDYGKITEFGSYYLFRDPLGSIYTSSRSGHLWRVRPGANSVEDMGIVPHLPDTNSLYGHHRALAGSDTGPDGRIWMSWVFSDYVYALDPKSGTIERVGNHVPEEFRHIQPNICTMFRFDSTGVLWTALGAPYLQHGTPMQLIRWDVMRGGNPQLMGAIGTPQRMTFGISETILDPRTDTLFIADTNHAEDPPVITVLDLRAISSQPAEDAVEMTDETLIDPLPVMFSTEAAEVFPQVSGSPAAKRYRECAEFMKDMNSFLSHQASTSVPSASTTAVRIWEHVPTNEGHVHSVRWIDDFRVAIECGSPTAPLHAFDWNPGTGALVRINTVPASPMGRQQQQSEGLPARSGRKFRAVATASCPVEGGLLLGTSDGMIARLDESSGKVTSYGALSVMGPVHQLAADPTSQRVYGVAGDEMDLGLIFQWDPEAGLLELGRPNFSLLTEPGQVICNRPTSVAVSSDGRSVAVGCMDRLGCAFVFVEPSQTNVS